MFLFELRPCSAPRQAREGRRWPLPALQLHLDSSEDTLVTLCDVYNSYRNKFCHSLFLSLSLSFSLFSLSLPPSLLLFLSPSLSFTFSSALFSFYFTMLPIYYSSLRRFSGPILSSGALVHISFNVSTRFSIIPSFFPQCSLIFFHHFARNT